MAPVRRLRNLAWMKARRLPGVRCSTLKTECRSLLCLMIMPGRSWVAGIDIAWKTLLHTLAVVKPAEGGGRPQVPPPRGLKRYFTLRCTGKETFSQPISSKMSPIQLCRIAFVGPRQFRTRISHRRISMAPFRQHARAFPGRNIED